MMCGDFLAVTILLFVNVTSLIYIYYYLYLYSPIVVQYDMMHLRGTIEHQGIDKKIPVTIID